MEETDEKLKEELEMLRKKQRELEAQERRF
jgi:hypothetical protein